MPDATGGCDLIRAAIPETIIEIRMDSAFFSKDIIEMLDEKGIEFSISVPFERFAELKGIIEKRKRWKRFNKNISYFETQWKPKSWDEKCRFLFIRSRSKIQQKGPLQLDLFLPHAYGYDFKVIVSNKKVRMKKVLAFHNGRGSQEGIFADLKTHSQMDYIATRKLSGNQNYLLAAISSHNLSRELQMATQPRKRNTTEKRTTLWEFQSLDTIRRNLIQRAGRLTRPRGKLTLTMSGNSQVKNEVLHFLEKLEKVA
jgi:hypothetical protein